MKLAIMSESPADETALRALLEASLPGAVQFLSPGLRARGWPSVAQVLPAAIRHLHFNTDADGLVVVVDADDSVVHTEAHERPDYFHPQCRICKLRAVFRQTAKKLPQVNGRRRVLRGVGVAVPAIEAWYLCGRDETVSEAAWLEGQEKGKAPYSRAELKLRVYGTDRPSLQHEIDCALREVRRHRGDLRRLEYDFPGFAYLTKDLRSWAPASVAVPAGPSEPASGASPSGPAGDRHISSTRAVRGE